MSNYTYNANIELHHNEAPAKINKNTGEITELNKTKVDKEPRDKSMKFFKTNQPYSQVFTKAWNLLETQTTDLEFKVAYKLALRAKAYTNSLEPIKPDSSLREIADELNISHNSVKAVFERLFKLGVIGKFEVYDKVERHHNYYIFNPYLSFNGKIIKKDVQTLFDNTFYASMSKSEKTI